MTKESFGLIGVGAFGALAARHLAKHFDLVLHDATADVAPLASEIGARVGDLRAASACDIVMLAVPVQKLRQVLTDIAPLLKPGALVLDVASVKMKPVAAMQEILPASVAIVGTHPALRAAKRQERHCGFEYCFVRCARRAQRGCGAVLCR